MYQIAPSIISADYMHLQKQFDILQKYNISYLHLDIMDGKFVPSICIDLPLIQSIRKNQNLILDAHIMTQNSYKMALIMAEIGCDIISIHLETQEPIMKTIKELKKKSKRVGIVINPSTPVEAVSDEILKEIDVFQVMSIEPGINGQTFQNKTLKKISDIYYKKKKLGLSFDIEVDGAINHSNLRQVLQSGANIFVSGTSLFSGNLESNIQRFQSIINTYKNTELL